MQINKITEQMLRMFPSWMKIRKDPESIGAQFLDVFGLEFEDIDNFLISSLNNQHVGSANLGEIDLIYRADILTHLLTKEPIIIGDTRALIVAQTAREFYEHTGDVCFIDRVKSLLYVRKPYRTLIADGQEVTLHLHHVWNCFDEFALLLGIYRLYGENNTELTERIKDVFLRPGNSTKQGLKNAIGRELRIAPDHIQLDSLGDYAFVGTLLNHDGTATRKLQGYVETLSLIAPVTWDSVVWDKSYWQALDSDALGLNYLPRIWDIGSDGWESSDFQSGIGDGKDLEVLLPEEHKDTQLFNYFIGIQGVNETTNTVYVPHSFSYRIKATGHIPENVIPSEDYHYTLEAAEIIPLLFTVRAYKEYVQNVIADYATPTGHIMDSSLEIIPGNRITSPPSRNVRIMVTMESHNLTSTPILDTLTLQWRNNVGVAQALTVDTQANWEAGTASGTRATPGGSLELARGQFQHDIATQTAWEKGTLTNLHFTGGRLRLIN